MHDTDFTPKLLRKGLRKELHHSIQTQTTIFLTFQEFKKRFGSGNHNLYHHFHSTVNKKGNWVKNDCVTIFLSPYKATTVSKVISKLYHCPQNHNSESTSYVRIKWKKEGNMIISEEAC